MTGNLGEGWVGDKGRTGSLVQGAVDVYAGITGCFGGFGDSGGGASLGLVDGVIDIGGDEEGKEGEKIGELHDC